MFIRNTLSNGREGFFKLESSAELTECDVFNIYRKRDTVEKLMDSLKNHIDMGPLRVWSDDSVKGILTICFLAQMIVSMIRYEREELSRLSTKTIIRSLEKLTVTVIPGAGKRKERIFSNFEPVNSLILGVKPPPDRVPRG
ncbi:IS1634 family transposase ISMma20 [bioreactor metagenome]|uniref:IS1634 family transposase ISMma20 n=1 Tax=bioreactor metagenome TaxID=1076179 RepID=A0A645CWK4_9ZZZZ